MKQLATMLLAAQALLAQPSRFGLPACQGPSLELANREFFVLCHDSALRVPVWTAYEILPSRMGGGAQRPSRFRSDSALAGPVARNSDYRGSGWTRGHLVPAEDFAFSSTAIRSTFVLSNSAPQLASVNTGLWRRVENAVRAVASESDAVYVLSGPLFAGPPTHFAGEVAVPAHFFKVWLAIQGTQKRMYAAIVPNARVCAESLDSAAVSVDDIEQRTGLDFFAELDDEEERHLESGIERLPQPLRRASCTLEAR